jgi:hypothetical protein
VPERPHFVITASGRVAAVPSGDDNIDTFLEYLVDDVGTRAPVVAMTRAQVLARIARSALPTGFPEADVVIGDADREGGFTRGWMEGTVAAWETAKLDSAAVVDSASADSEAAPSAGRRPRIAGEVPQVPAQRGTRRLPDRQPGRSAPQTALPRHRQEPRMADPPHRRAQPAQAHRTRTHPHGRSMGSGAPGGLKEAAGDARRRHRAPYRTRTVAGFPGAGPIAIVVTAIKGISPGWLRSEGG